MIRFHWHLSDDGVLIHYSYHGRRCGDIRFGCHAQEKGRDCWHKLNKNERISCWDLPERGHRRHGSIRFCYIHEPIRESAAQVWRIMTNLKANQCKQRDPEEIEAVVY